jgi:vancomycin resistance protein VanJ
MRMSEDAGRDSKQSKQYWIKRVFVWVLATITLLYSGLIVAFYLGDAFKGNDSWLIDMAGYILPLLFVPTIFLLPLALLSKSKGLIVAAAIPMILFLLTYGSLFLPPGLAGDAQVPITVMSFNVLDLNEQYDEVAEQINIFDPDILGLHELEPHMVNGLEELLSSRYPYREIEPGRGIFSRYPIARYTAFQLGEDGHWAQEVVVDVDGHPLTLLNVHPRSPRVQYGSFLGLPSDFRTDKRDRDFADLISRIADHEGALIVMGDMNLSDRQDQYAELREYLQDVHRERGWGFGFTRTNYPETGVPMWRIDYIFYSPELKALTAEVGDFAGSDHRPVIARIGFVVVDQ